MDTSEDVEMSDVSEKKDEKVETKEAVQTETKECVKDQPPKEIQKSDTKTEEPMITDAKDVSNTEKVMENVVTDKIEVQPSEVSTKADISENVSVVSNNTESTSIPSKNDVDKSVDSEKIDKPLDIAEKVVESTPVEATVTANDPLDVVACEPKLKFGEVSIVESKTDESTNVTKETKPEDSKVSDVKTNENTSEEKNSSSSVEEKTEECTSKSEKETKEESTDKATINPSTIETQKPENEVSLVKPAQEPTKIEDKPTENGDVSLTNAEKVIAPTITEPEATSSKAETNAEVKNLTEAVTETKPEIESELINEKSPKAKETEEAAVPVNDAEKNEVSTEVSKPESTEKSVKEETVVDEVKETNTVDSEKKKLNGTTQNGDTDTPVSDDKLHRNGLNEGSSNENVNSSTSESTSAQNGEPESSSEANAESIKVKKVVDSTVADGAGEPDIVPPVVVAATS